MRHILAILLLVPTFAQANLTASDRRDRLDWSCENRGLETPDGYNFLKEYESGDAGKRKLLTDLEAGIRQMHQVYDRFLAIASEEELHDLWSLIEIKMKNSDEGVREVLAQVTYLPIKEKFKVVLFKWKQEPHIESWRKALSRVENVSDIKEEFEKNAYAKDVDDYYVNPFPLTAAAIRSTRTWPVWGYEPVLVPFAFVIDLVYAPILMAWDVLIFIADIFETTDEERRERSYRHSCEDSSTVNSLEREIERLRRKIRALEEKLAAQPDFDG